MFVHGYNTRDDEAAILLREHGLLSVQHFLVLAHLDELLKSVMTTGTRS